MGQDGIDVVLDQWDFSGGDDRFHFMEQSVKDPSVTKILIFSDRLYADKADGRLGGVGAETQIFTPELYGEVKDSKFIPIACESDDDGQAYMPIYLKSRIFTDFRKEGDRATEYHRLVKQLYGLPEKEKPPLGTPPSYVTNPNKPHRKSRTRFEYWERATAIGSAALTAAERDYLVEFSSEMPSYYLPLAAEEDQHDALVRTLKAMVPIRNELFRVFLAILSEDPERAPQRIAGIKGRLTKFKFYSEKAANWEAWKAEAIAFFCWDLWPCAKSAGSSARCSRWPGCKIRPCDAASRRASTRAKPETPSPRLCFSIGWARSKTVPSKSSNIAPAVSIGSRRHHTVEHGLSGTRPHFAWKIPRCRYGLAPTRLAARLGARRPDGRLSLALR
jgi:hypothetical protein